VVSALQLLGFTTLKGGIMKTKYLQYLSVLSILIMVFPVGALAGDKAHSVEIPYVVEVGSTRLTAGNYKVAWQGTGPAVEVSFSQYGKTVITVPGTLKTNDDQVTQDAIVTEATSPNTTTLKEIDFGHQKEALVFDQNDQNPSGQ
jgi:hypothetical protein